MIPETWTKRSQGIIYKAMKDQEHTRTQSVRNIFPAKAMKNTDILITRKLQRYLLFTSIFPSHMLVN